MGGETPECPPDKEEDSDAPLQFLAFYHKAIREELLSLHQMVVTSLEGGSPSPETVRELDQRFKFLEQAQKYHSAAEDEVIFLALDDHVKNVVCKYSLEHKSIDGLFGSVFGCLNALMDGSDNVIKLFQELVICIGTLRTLIDEHMVKEEQQIFRLLMKQFTFKEQASLVWRLVCSIPVILLEDLFPWMISFCSPEEQIKFRHCMREIVSKNKLLQEVVISWLDKNHGSSSEVYTRSGKVVTEGPVNMKYILRQGSNSSVVEPLAVDKGKNYVTSLASSFQTVHPYEMPYSSRIHLHIFFPVTLGILQPCMKSSNGSRNMPSIIKEPAPIDLIFIFHKALKKNLLYFVSGSAKLAENNGFLEEFHKNFHLTRCLYQFHSDAEDEIAFPALEAKVDLHNISQSYTIEHKLEVEHFTKVSLILDEISDWKSLNSDVDLSTFDKRMVKHRQLRLKLQLQEMCESMCKLLTDHIHHEETELWPLFREHFSFEEQEKIIGRMLGRISAEVLRDLIPWLMASLTPEEQHAMMFLYRKITRNTMFDDWLAVWWEGYGTVKVEREPNISPSDAKDPLEIISTYMSKVFDEKGGVLCSEGFDSTQEDCSGAKTELLGKSSFDDKKGKHDGHLSCYESSEHEELFSEGERCKEVSPAASQTEKPTQTFLGTQNSRHHERLQTMSQYDLEATIRRVSHDASLDPQEKSFMIQNFLTSRWIVRQQLSHSEQKRSSDGEEIHGQCPSYRDSLRVTFGCQHYKRNCKLVTACCNQLYTCIRCHDEVADHLVDRKSVTKMMCMKCLIIQPIGPNCSTASCNSLSMARHYCQICKLFDDNREIYHCPYCNLCRVGKGLGIDYFHCMKCNACMSRSLSAHICREKCLEDNCPICHEYIFTSSLPVKALPCGHLMHSACFQDYTCTNYTCPICSKSLGDMQVYFKMLDTLLAEEKMPDEYSGQTQAILCNDCEKKGNAPFHWLYHKCSYCGSYNTRLL